MAEVHRFGEFLIDCGEVTSEEVFEALNIQRARTDYIGAIAIKEQVLTVRQVMRVLREQAGTAKRFGDLAIELGLMEQRDLVHLLGIQRNMRPYLGEILVEMKLLDPISRDQLLEEFHSKLKKTG